MFPLHPTDLGLILSYQCQCACAHCLYNCAPQRKGWISEADLQAALQATRVWPQPYQVHLTGGEPFLNYPLLLRAVQTAAQLNIPCYVETNGGWCTSEGLARRRFEELQQNGLQAVLVSCSPFHAETIPLRRTLAVIQAARTVLGPERTMVYLPEWVELIGRTGVEQPLALDAYVQLFGQAEAGRLFWQGYGLQGGGRAGPRLGRFAPTHYPAQHFSGRGCRSELLYARHSHFDLHGNFIPAFCGGLALGSWRDLPALLQQMRADQLPPLLQVLSADGPYGLAQMAAADYAYQPLAEGYADKCHLCADVRRWLFGRAHFTELAPAGFYQNF